MGILKLVFKFLFSVLSYKKKKSEMRNAGRLTKEKPIQVLQNLKRILHRSQPEYTKGLQ